MDQDNQPLSSRGQAQTTWIFILKPEMLAGQFTVQLFRPDPRVVPNVILKEACRAFSDASQLMSTLLEAGIDGDTYKLYAKLIEQRLATRFAGLVPVEVLTWDELFHRAEKGEFHLRLMKDWEIIGMNRRCRSLQEKVNKEALHEAQESASALGC